MSLLQERIHPAGLHFTMQRKVVVLHESKKSLRCAESFSSCGWRSSGALLPKDQRFVGRRTLAFFLQG